MLFNELIQEFLFDCKIRDLSEVTIYNYSKQLSLFERYLSEKYGVTLLEQLTTQQIKYYISFLQEQGRKPSYINDMLKAIKVLCAYAHREEYTATLLTKRVKNVKEPKVLIHTFSDKEIKRLVKYYDGNDYISLRNKLIIMILFDTGIRISELINMRPDQIQDNYFLIYGKGRKERVVPKNPRRLRYAHHLQRRYDDGDKTPARGIRIGLHAGGGSVSLSPLHAGGGIPRQQKNRPRHGTVHAPAHRSRGRCRGLADAALCRRRACTPQAIRRAIYLLHTCRGTLYGQSHRENHG
jgi:integrase